VGKFKLADSRDAGHAMAAPAPAAPSRNPQRAPQPVKPAAKMEPALAGANGHARNGHAHNGHAARPELDGFEEF
jgi:hypothetical protein